MKNNTALITVFLILLLSFCSVVSAQNFTVGPGWSFSNGEVPELPTPEPSITPTIEPTINPTSTPTASSTETTTPTPAIPEFNNLTIIALALGLIGILIVILGVVKWQRSDDY